MLCLNMGVVSWCIYVLVELALMVLVASGTLPLTPCVRLILALSNHGLVNINRLGSLGLDRTQCVLLVLLDIKVPLNMVGVSLI